MTRLWILTVGLGFASHAQAACPWEGSASSWFRCLMGATEVVDVNEDALAVLDGEVAALAADLDSTGESVSILDENYETARADLASTQDDVASVQVEVDALDAWIADLSAAHLVATEDLSSLIDTVDDALTDLYSALSEDVDALFSDVADLSLSMSLLEDEVATLSESGGVSSYVWGDVRDGCPSSHAAEEIFWSEDFSVDVDSSLVQIHAQLPRDADGRSDLRLHLLLDGVDQGIVSQVITYTPEGVAQWATGQVQWQGTLDAGNWSAGLSSNTSDDWGCGTDWGRMSVAIFE